LFNPILAGILENQDTLRGGEGRGKCFLENPVI